jgi:2-keto-3-deoxy-L-rhamnonate aldolase RhmA
MAGETNMLNPLAARLRAGQLGLALMVKHARTVNIALAAKTCGFDAIYFDMQHGGVPEDAVAEISAAAVHVGVTPIVRISPRAYGQAVRMLDCGALGIIVPDMASVTDAREAVEYCKFAPVGKRSNASRYPQFAFRAVPGGEARSQLNENTLLIGMIESRAALEVVENIAAVPGLDVLHVGSSDLASDLGVPGENSHPLVTDAVSRVVAACRRHGKVAGLGGFSGGGVASIGQALGLGVRFVTAANEWSLMMTAAQERVNELRRLPLE